jgi:hypothetical protein
MVRCYCLRNGTDYPSHLFNPLAAGRDGLGPALSFWGPPPAEVPVTSRDAVGPQRLHEMPFPFQEAKTHDVRIESETDKKLNTHPILGFTSCRHCASKPNLFKV